MGYRTPLKLHTVLAFDDITCHIEEVIGRGTNAIVYKGWYLDGLNKDVRHQVLIKELFPSHPDEKIWRSGNNDIIVEPEAEDFWKKHKESFEVGNRVHLRLLYDHPELMVMGANLNSYRCYGTIYSLLGYTGGRSLLTELRMDSVSLRNTTCRMILLLDALEAFHKSGYLHLDISPVNIMLVGRGNQERLFLIDYNSAREVGSLDKSHLSHKEGYSAPEITTGNLRVLDFTSDLYSVAAVFYRCLMGRTLTLTEIIQRKAPDGHDSPVLLEVPQTVKYMVSTILRKGLDARPHRRYQSIGQMRQAFRELLERIDCVGVTHWSLWENGKRSVEALIRNNPSLHYLEDEKNLYPIRLEQEYSMSLATYLDNLLSSEGKSGMIVAQGGMGKTTLLLHAAALQGKRYSAVNPAIFYISLNSWDKADTNYILSQILMRLRFKKEENNYDSAMHTLYELLEQPIQTKQGDIPTVLMLLDGLNEVQGDIAPLVQEINELIKMAGVRILVTSRIKVPELELETVELIPLHTEDVEEALEKEGLLIPRRQDMIQLLRTPLILSIYIQASEGGKQLDIEDKDQLMKAYMDSLLEKEIRQLPEDAPQRWQIDVALNYVLPTIAAAEKQNGRLTTVKLLKNVEECWKVLRSSSMQRAFPQWIGHSRDIFGDMETAEEWYGLMIHGLLWKRLGLLTKDDDSGSYRIFHQLVADYLSEIDFSRITRLRRQRLVLRILPVAALLVLSLWCGYSRRNHSSEDIEKAIERTAAGYSSFGVQYEQLRELTDFALEENSEDFFLFYQSRLSSVSEEATLTDIEAAYIEDIQQDILSEGPRNVAWSGQTFAGELAAELIGYTATRCSYYEQILPLLEFWMSSEKARSISPEFAERLSMVLEADAAVASELYHQSCAVHLDTAEGAWVQNARKLISNHTDLETHRIWNTIEDRGSYLENLRGLLEDAEEKLENARDSVEMEMKYGT